MADHEVWEVRYLLVRVEGVLDQAARGWTPWLEDTLRKELASAADDLERAGTLVESIGLTIPGEIVERARMWGLLSWRFASQRRQFLADRDEVLRLEGRVEQALTAMGIHEDTPPKLTESEQRRERASNRRGRGATVTAAG